MFFQWPDSWNQVHGLYHFLSVFSTHTSSTFTLSVVVEELIRDEEFIDISPCINWKGSIFIPPMLMS